MSENENKDQADELRKEIAYLSGLIKSAKTKSNFQKVSSARTSINNFHVQSRSQYHQQNNFVPFPKSSKYIAPSVLSKTSTGKNEIVKNHQKSTKYTASKGNLSKSVSYPVLSNSKSVQNKDVPQCFHGASSSMFQKHPNQDLSKFSERLHSVNFDHETKSSIKKNLEFKEVQKVKVHVNPKFLKSIPNSSCASTSNMPVVKLSDTMSHSVNIGSKVVPKATEKSFNSLRHSSKNIESQILALRKSLGYEVPPVTNSLTVPNASKKNWVHKFTGNESALQPNHPDIQKQIINLRKTLGYEIPSVLPIDNTEEQIRKLRASLGYELHDDDNRKIKESNSSKISKSQSDLYHYSPTTVKSLSPYKINRNFKTNSASAKLKLSFTRDQFRQPNTRPWTSKYVLNRKKTTKKLSPKIIKSRFKYIVKSQIKDTPMKMSASSTTQRAAKTIVSKYKIRKIPEVKKSKLFYNQTVDYTSYNLKCPRRKSWQDQDKKLPTFSSAYKWSSKSKNDSEANIYSWRRLSQSSLNSYKGRPCINQLNKSSIHHLNILRRNQRYKTDRRSSCNSNLVFINGFLYKTTGNSMLKTGSKKVDNRKNRSLLSSWNKNKSSCIIIKKINGKETKTVQVRGVIFEMASNGHSLKRIDTGTGERKSPEKRNRVTRIDLHGITYIQTKPGTLVKMDTLRTRTVKSRVINKSITTIITNKQRKKVNKQYCIYYNRFGKCNRGNLCQFLHDPDKVAVCTRFLRGTCKVKDCLFSHQVSEDKMPVCSYFLKGRCDKDDCPYLHVKVSQNAAICLSFINGYCPNGKECKKLHSRICPEFSKTGKCKSGKQCQLEHKRKNAIKRKNSRSRKETSTIATKEDSTTVEESTTPANKLPSYISLVEYSSPYIPPNTNKGYSDTQLDQDDSLHIKPRL